MRKKKQKKGRRSAEEILAGPEVVLTVPEVGEVLRIGRSSAYEGVRCGEIPSVRIGGRLLVPKKAIHRLLEGGEGPPPP